MACGGECACSKANFGLSHPVPGYFVQSQWRIPQVVYFIWRVIAAVFFIVWTVLSGVIEYYWFDSQANRVKWFIYLTNWMFFLLAVNTIVEAIVVGISLMRSKHGEPYQEMPWFYKMSWVLYNVASDIGIVVSIAFWALLAPELTEIHYVDIITHGVNAVYIVINFFITATPIRIQHFWHPLVFSVTYAIFSLIYDLSGGTNALSRDYIYNVLDWSDTPGLTTGYAVLVGLIAPILIWLIFYGLYRLRIAIYRCCGCRNYCDIDGNVGSQDIMLSEKSDNNFGSV